MDLCDSDDDVFVSLSDNEWQSLKASRLKDGFREGISHGQADSVQDGFNKGYEIGFTYVKNAAELRGYLWGLQGVISNCHSLDETKKCDAIEQLQTFVKELQTIERNIIEVAKTESSTHQNVHNSIKNTTAGQLTDTPRSSCNETTNDSQPTNFNQELDTIKKSCIRICNDIGINISFDCKN